MSEQIKQVLKPLNINLDLNPNLMKSDMACFLKGIQYDINNGLVGNSGGKNLGVETPQLSNVEGFGNAQKVLLPAGVNICIGSHYDKKTNQIYWFNWNENSDHNIWLFNANTETYFLVLSSPLLNFQLANRLSAIDFILLDNSNSVNNVNQFLRLLYFTDGYNPPRKFDVDKALSGAYNVLPNWYVTPDEYIRAVKYPPYLRPHLSITYDSSFQFNYLAGNQYQFRTRFWYDDREKSKCSPISELGYTYTSPCQLTANAANLITLTNLAGSIIVDKIEVMYRIGNFGEWRSIDVLSRQDILTNAAYAYNAVDNTWQYKFYNNKAYTPVAPEITNPNFDVHPLKCFAQEFIETNQLVYADILEGYDNVDWATKTDAFRPTLTVTYPAMLLAATRTVTFDIVIHNPLDSINQLIWRIAPNGDVVYGGLFDVANHVTTIGTGYKQYAPNLGFTAYKPGTVINATSSQYLFNGATYTPVGVPLINDAASRFNTANVINGGNSFIQRVTLKGLPQDKCVIRISDPRITDLSNTNFHQTSTTVAGFTSISAYNPIGNPTIVKHPNEAGNDLFEFEVDLCAGDYNMASDNLMMVIWDLTKPTGTSTVSSGYIRDQLADNKTGIELLQISANDVNGDTHLGYSNLGIGQNAKNTMPTTTDHNGFYYIAEDYSTVAGDLTLTFYDHFNAGYSPIQTFIQTGAPDQLNEDTLTVNLAAVPTYYTDAITYIKGRIIDVNGIPVGGIPVVYTRGHWAITDGNGNFSILVHNDSLIATRVLDVVLVEQNGVCLIDFGSGVYCHVNAIVINDLKHVGNCAAGFFNSTTFVNLFPQNCVGVNAIVVSVVFWNQRGLKAGGRYKFTGIYFDEALRSTYCQYYEGLNQYILSQPEKFAAFGAGNMVGFPHIVFNMNGTVHPTGMKYFAVARTRNLNNNDNGTTAYNGYLQWLIDTVKFEDDYGNEVAVGAEASATKVRITINGLNTFNTQHFNTTTTTYQFVEDDIILLIRNGDAGQTVYTPAITGHLQDTVLHSTDSITFVIDNNAEISTVNKLVPNALVELYHPNIQQTTDVFFEITDLYPIVNGQLCNPYPQLIAGVLTYVPLAAQQIVLNTWDTYFINRTIPQMVIIQVGVPPVDVPVPGVPTNIGQPYESLDYSDLFTSKGGDIGRINVINADAKQLWKPALVRWSYVFIPSTRINGLSSFDEENSKQYYRQYGAILKLQCIGTNFYLIQEEKWFRVMLNKNLLTTGDAQPLVSLTSQLLSDPVETEGLFGCQNPETFDEREGAMVWADVKRGAIVLCDGVKAVDISEGKFKSYLIDKFKYFYDVNHDNTIGIDYFMHGKIDVRNKNYHLTIWTMKKRTFDRSYINNERGINIPVSETIKIDFESGELVLFPAFTPENYGVIEGHRKGLVFVTFKDGSPYLHNINTTTTFNTFYGVKTDQVIEIISNGGQASDVKVYGNIAIESNDIGYEADTIVTSESGQLSALLLANFEENEGIFYSDFQCDQNSAGGIIDGNNLRGTFIKIRLIRDTSQQDVYSELNNIIIYGNQSFLSNK